MLAAFPLPLLALGYNNTVLDPNHIEDQVTRPQFSRIGFIFLSALEFKLETAK